MIRFVLFLLVLSSPVFTSAVYTADDSTTTKPTQPTTVVVTEFQNRHPLLDQDWLSSALADLITTALLSAASDPESKLTVLDRTGIAALDKESILAADGISAQGAIAMRSLGGSYLPSADGKVTIDVVLSSNGKQLWSQKISGTTDQLQALARRIASGALASMSLQAMSVSEVNNTAVDLPIAALVTFQRGRAAMARGDYAAAVADLLRTCKLSPNHGEAWLALGNCFAELGRMGAAMAALQQAINVDSDYPGLAVALFRLALANEKKNPAQARQLYETIMENFPFSPAPAELLENKYSTQRIRISDLATQRSAMLRIEEPANDTAQSGQLVENGSQALDNTSASSRAGDVAADYFRRRLDAIAFRKSNDRYYYERGTEELLRLSMLSAAGGWPAGWATTQLPDQKPVLISSGSVAIAPPPGTVIESITARAVSKQGKQISCSLYVPDYEIDIGGRPLLTSKLGTSASVDIPAKLASGFYAEMRISDERKIDGNDQLELTAKLRPERPGVLWITSQPAGALVYVDDEERAVTPCRIRDLAPGKHVIRASTSVIKRGGGFDREVQKFVQFGGEASVEVAAQGETRVNWQLQHMPEVEAEVSGWSKMSMQIAPPTHVDVYGANKPFNTQRHTYNPIFLQDDTFGKVLFWQEEGEIYVAFSKPGKKWERIDNLSFNSASLEYLITAGISPTGQILVLFKRDRELFATQSTDLIQWSRPEEVSKADPLTDSSDSIMATEVRWMNAGHWLVVFVKSGTGHCHVASSADGRKWEQNKTDAIQPKEWWAEKIVALSLLADGRPTLVRRVRVREDRGYKFKFARYELKDSTWSIIDESQEFPHKDFSVNESKLFIDRDGSISHYVPGALIRWKPGGEVVRSPAPRFPVMDFTLSSDAKETQVYIPHAGSWWLTTTGKPDPIVNTAPHVTYENPTGVSKPVVQSSGGDKPAHISTNVTSAESPQTIVANGDPSERLNMQTTEQDKPAKPSRSWFTIIFVMLAVVVVTAGVSWWWYGVISRKRLGDQS